MRYGPIVASAAILLGVAACSGRDSGIDDGLAKDLAAARSNDGLALAPHSGARTVVSSQELTPAARMRLQSSKRSSRPTSGHVAPRVTKVASTPELDPLPPVTTADQVAADEGESDEPDAVPIVAQVPQPVAISYPAGPGPSPSTADNGIGVVGSILGAIGGAVLRGGRVDGDHCDPRGRHRGILINRRGPVLRGTY